MRIFVIAGSHALPAFEPTDTPFRGVARLVSFRVMELGVRAPGPDRNDSLDALPCPPRAAGVAIPGPVRDQAEQRRGRSGCLQG